MNRTHFRWIIVALLFFITVTNYVDRASIAYAMQPMKQLFHFNPKEVGLIFGAFGLGYLITTFLGGIAVDRYGARIVLGIATFCWSLAVGLTGLATGFFVAYLARSLLGIAEGPNFPAITRAVGDWLPKNERATALANTLIAVPLALAIGAPLVTYLIDYITWRGMFSLLGVIGILWVPLWWLLYRDFPENSRFVDQKELDHIREKSVDREVFNAKETYFKRRHLPGTWKFLLSTPTLIANNWAFFVFGYFLFFFMTWLPAYLADQYHLNLKQIGLFSIAPWLLATIALWLTGYLSDYIIRKTGNPRWARSYPIWISQLLAALCIVPILMTHDIYKAILFISLAVTFSMSANAAFYSVNVGVAKERAGSSLGIMDSGFALSGFIAPTVTGWLVDTTHSFTSAFLLLALLAFSSVLLVFFWHHPESTKQLEEINYNR